MTPTVDLLAEAEGWAAAAGCELRPRAVGCGLWTIGKGS